MGESKNKDGMTPQVKTLAAACLDTEAIALILSLRFLKEALLMEFTGLNLALLGLPPQKSMPSERTEPRAGPPKEPKHLRRATAVECEL